MMWVVRGDRDDVNSTFLQPFANYNLGGGPTVASPEGGASWRFRFMAILMLPR